MPTRTYLAAIYVCLVTFLASGSAAAEPARADVPPATVDAAPPPTVDAPKIAQARARFSQGVALYNDGDYKLALIEFQRSYDLAPHWRVLYNLGEVHYQLNNYAHALKSLQEYVRQGGNEIPDARRAEVEREISTLQVRTAKLTVNVNVPGAEIFLGDSLLGTAPLAGEQLVDSGSLKVLVTKAGYTPVTKMLTLAGSDTKVLDIVMDKIEAAPIRPEARSMAHLWVSWVATGIISAGAVGVGIAGYNADADLESLKRQRNVTRDQLDSKNSQVRTLTLTRDILIVTAIVSFGVSTFFTVKEITRSPSKDKAARPRTPQFGVGLGSVTLNGEF